MTDSTPPRTLDLEGFKRIGCRPLIVTLNGAQQRYVVAYDVDGGWVERYKVDERGNLSIYQDEYLSELVRGVVMVFWG